MFIVASVTTLAAIALVIYLNATYRQHCTLIRMRWNDVTGTEANNGSAATSVSAEAERKISRTISA